MILTLFPKQNYEYTEINIIQNTLSYFYFGFYIPYAVYVLILSSSDPYSKYKTVYAFVSTIGRLLNASLMTIRADRNMS
jgi:hypothetical protein